MFAFAARFIFGTLAFPLADYLLYGLWCNSLQSALLAGACLMTLYLLIRPLSKIVLFAFNLLTLGLLGIFIDSTLIMMTMRLFPSAVQVKSFEWAILAALIINLVRAISGKLVRAR